MWVSTSGTTISGKPQVGKSSWENQLGKSSWENQVETTSGNTNGTTSGKPSGNQSQVRSTGILVQCGRIPQMGDINITDVLKPQSHKHLTFKHISTRLSSLAGFHAATLSRPTATLVAVVSRMLPRRRSSVAFLGPVEPMVVVHAKQHQPQRWGQQ